MPHILLEYSGNVAAAIAPRALFADLHEAIEPLGDIDVAYVKSRALRHDDVYIGDGDPKRSFVHLQVQLMDGRSESVRQQLSRACMSVLLRHIDAAAVGETCGLSVEVRQMDRNTYVKQDVRRH